MISANQYKEGSVLEFKKPHPCGSKRWTVLKVGVDYKLECCGCQRVIIIPRIDLKKRVKKEIISP